MPAEPTRNSDSSKQLQVSSPGDGSVRATGHVVSAELKHWLNEFCEAKTLRKRTTSLIGLVSWMRRGSASVVDPSGLAGFVEYLDNHFEQRARFQTAFAGLLSEMNCIPLFAEAGIPSDHSFVSEIGHRISARLLPSAR